MAPYQYRPLDEAKGELRLLRLQPASWGEDVKLHIQHVPLCESQRIGVMPSALTRVQATLPPGWTVYETLEGRCLFENTDGDYCSWIHPNNSIPRYNYTRKQTEVNKQYAFEALSYTWGNDLETTSIHIVDVDLGTTGDLLVRPNLATALQYLRFADRERTLWIDAICIDQSNLEERGKQVKRMDQIYRFAKQVNVWLGPESQEDNSARAMEILGYIGAQVEYSKDQSYLEAPSCQEKGWFRPDVEIPLTDREATAVRTLLERPWFSRLWITQEVQLANDSARLYCGRDSISWYHFRRAVLALDVKQTLNALLPLPLLAKVSNLVFYNRSTPSLKLLWATRRAQCYDSRDRIYAVLGLLEPRFSMLVNPDYNITPSATYQRACQTWLDAYDKLSFLEFCDMPKVGGNGPSWVPDWSKGLPREPMTFGRFASGQSCTGGARIIDDSILEVVGVECGVISWIEDLTQREGHGTWDYWRRVSKEVLRFDEKFGDPSDPQLDDFVATLCGNRVREMYPSHIYWPTVSQCKRSLESAGGGGLRRSETGFDAFQNSVQDFTHGRRFFQGQGFVGFGAQSIAEGMVGLVVRTQRSS